MNLRFEKVNKPKNTSGHKPIKGSEISSSCKRIQIDLDTQGYLFNGTDPVQEKKVSESCFTSENYSGSMTESMRHRPPSG